LAIRSGAIRQRACDQVIGAIEKAFDTQARPHVNGRPTATGGCSQILERAKGIEPSYAAWEAVISDDQNNRIRTCLRIKADRFVYTG
jgi:hypothetical protein